MTAASFPRPPFRDVGSLKSHELYAFAGLVPKMPESVRATLVLMIQAREAYHERGTSDYHRDAAAECRAILEAMEADR